MLSPGKANRRITSKRKHFSLSACSFCFRMCTSDLSVPLRQTATRTRWLMRKRYPSPLPASLASPCPLFLVWSHFTLPRDRLCHCYNIVAMIAPFHGNIEGCRLACPWRWKISALWLLPRNLFFKPAEINLLASYDLQLLFVSLNMVTFSDEAFNHLLMSLLHAPGLTLKSDGTLHPN